MVKRKVIDLPTFASTLAAAQAAGFNIDEIAVTMTDVFLGRMDAKDIPAEIMTEIEDVVLNFTSDPLGSSFGVGAAVAVNELGFALLGGMLDFIPGAKKRINIGKKLTIKLAR